MASVRKISWLFLGLLLFVAAWPVYILLNIPLDFDLDLVGCSILAATVVILVSHT